MPHITIRNLGRDTLLTAKFLSALKLDCELGKLLTRIKDDLVTQLITLTLQARLPQDEFFAHDVTHFFNQYAADLGLPAKSTDNLSYTPRYDAEMENQFKEDLTKQLTCSHILQRIYDEIKENIVTIASDTQKSTITKFKMIAECLQHFGEDDKFDLSTPDRHCIEQDIQISLMHRLASRENAYFNLNSLETTRQEFYNVGATQAFVNYTRFPENTLLSYVVPESGSRYAFISFIQSPINRFDFEDYCNSFDELFTLLQHIHEDKLAGILNRAADIEHGRLIKTDVEKKAIISITPHKQRSRLPAIFKSLLTNAFSLDELFSNKFFQAADVDKVAIDFALPDKPESLRAFLESDAGTLYKNGVRSIIEKLIVWSQQNHPSVKINNLRHLITLIENYSGDTKNINLKKFRLYCEGPSLLLGILHKIEDKTATKNEMENRKEILKNVVDTFVVCEPGIHTNLVFAYAQMSGSTTVMMMEVRRQIVEQITLEILREQDYVDEYNRGNEIHFVNSVINHYAMDLGLNVIDDYFAIIFVEGTISELYNIICSSIAPRIQQALTLSKVVEYICTQNFGNVLNKIKSVNSENYVAVMESIRESLDIYGRDENFSDSYFVRLNWLTSGTVAENPEMIQAQLIATIMIRLINSGFINKKQLTRKTVGEITYLIPNGNYHLALILLPDGKCQGFNSYLLKQLFQTPLAEIESAQLEVLEDLNNANKDYLLASQQVPVDKNALKKSKELVSLAMQTIVDIETEATIEIKRYEEIRIEQEQQVSSLFGNLFREFFGLFPTSDDINKLRNIYKSMPAHPQHIFINDTFSSIFNKIQSFEATRVDFLTLDDRLRELPESEHSSFLNETAVRIIAARLVCNAEDFNTLSMRSPGITSTHFHTILQNHINSSPEHLLNYLKTFRINQTPVLNYLDTVNFNAPAMIKMLSNLRSSDYRYVLVLIYHAPESQLNHIITQVYNHPTGKHHYIFLKFLKEHLILRVANDNKLSRIISLIGADHLQTALVGSKYDRSDFLSMLNRLSIKPKSLQCLLDLIGNDLIIKILKLDEQGLAIFANNSATSQVLSHIFSRLPITFLLDKCLNITGRLLPQAALINLQVVLKHSSPERQEQLIKEFFKLPSIYPFINTENFTHIAPLPYIFKLAILEELLLIEEDNVVEHGTLGAFMAYFPDIVRLHQFSEKLKLVLKFEKKIDEQMLILQNRVTQPDSSVLVNKTSKITVLIEVKNAINEFTNHAQEEDSFVKLLDTIIELKAKSEKIAHVGYFNSIFNAYSFTTRILSDFSQAAQNLIPTAIIVEEVPSPRPQIMA